MKVIASLYCIRDFFASISEIIVDAANGRKSVQSCDNPNAAAVSWPITTGEKL